MGGAPIPQNGCPIVLDVVLVEQLILDGEGLAAAERLYDEGAGEDIDRAGGPAGGGLENPEALGRDAPRPISGFAEQAVERPGSFLQLDL